MSVDGVSNERRRVSRTGCVASGDVEHHLGAPKRLRHGPGVEEVDDHGFGAQRADRRSRLGAAHQGADRDASLEEMLVELIEKGAAVNACGTCCQTRAIPGPPNSTSAGPSRWMRG